ncbi:NlpC/P60 family protein [Fodinisporobacter ferrooxydans]|uniref:NlpC/P60 family protein n=1 Tax=Fodinisporobacter ferrooxydans TaxID=2901836 RepID=A0ABY4CKD8_9BACL|nr:NlpC/P60 family protein [Alicyclobacillaceae bacterium MYW30-H2]
MPKKVLAAFLCAGTITTVVFFPAPAFAAVGDTVLEYGSQGADVQTLQEQLKELGYFPNSVETTGYFGTTTKQAVLAFKNDYKLTDKEKVGKTTETAILKALAIKKASASSSDTLRKTIIDEAKSLNGSPYQWGGASPSGFDCSGFTKYVFAQAGTSLPRSSQDQYGIGKAVDKAALKPGDLVFFSTYDSGPSHVGIYLGSGKFISADSTKVQIDSIDDPYYWGPRYVGARSVIEN